MSESRFIATNQKNGNGSPGTGRVDGCGVTIKWRNEGQPTDDGLKISTFCEIGLHRLQFLQQTSMGGREVSIMFTKLQELGFWAKDFEAKHEIDGASNKDV